MAEEARAPQPEQAPSAVSVGLNFLPVGVKYDIHKVVGPDGTPLVLTTFETPIGTMGYFFDGASAEEFGRKMQEAGRTSRLVIAGEGILDQIVENGQRRKG